MKAKILPTRPWLSGKNAAIWLIIGLIGAFCLAAIFITPAFGDEIDHHYPLAREISLARMTDPAANYSSAYPPLPYWIGRLALRAHPALVTLRLLNYLVFLTAVFFFHRLARRTRCDPALLTLLFFLNPYLLKASFVYLMTNWGLMFSLIGIYLYFDERKATAPAAHLFLSAAVLSQQWMLAIVLAIALYELVSWLEGKITREALWRGMLLKALALAPAFCLFGRWRGLVHPNLSSHALQPTFEHGNAVLANLGLVMLFLVIFHLRSLLSARHLPLLFMLPLLWLAVPRHSTMHGPFLITGIASQLSEKLARFTPIPYRASFIVLIAVGLALLVLLLKKNDEGMPAVARYAVLGFMAAFAASARLAASHIYVCVPFILLLFSGEIGKKGRVRITMAGQYLLLSSAYLIYTVFYRSRGVLF